MRCPKCQYISFDDGDKCRNCGYEFSLSFATDDLDLPIEEPDVFARPNLDLSLTDANQRVSHAPTPDPARGDRPTTGSLDLPLFRDGASGEDRSLVSVPPVTRAPLAVRKGSLNMSRPASRRDDEPHLDLEPTDDVETAWRRPAVHPDPHAPSPPIESEVTSAPAGARILSGLVDVCLLLAIDFGVLRATMRICGLIYSELPLLPIAPFAAFLLILNGGYLAAFTAAGGQSVGKMLGGIRVVPDDAVGSTDRVPLGQAVLRAAAYFLSALPFGVGFLPAVFSADKRAFHDRLAHTRVIKA
ncbi:MAG: RDD family protein [Vicinamibacterales bacterium]